MFKKARIKLTAWYLLIIMLVSVLFSVAIYAGINRELARFERLEKFRTERARGVLPNFRQFPRLDQKEIIAARNRLILNLILINFAILVISGGAGYFLAGRTLKPIMRMVDEQNRFITDASHELKTPITSLRSEIEVNLRDKKLNLGEAKKLLKSNLEEVVSLGVLSDSLLELTQSNTKQQIFKQVALSEVIENAKKKIASQALRKKIVIDTHLENEFVLGDEISLFQVFLILLDNAIKYSPANTKVLVTGKRLDGTVEVKIKDQGIGIEEQDLAHIFERFYRADKARSKKVSGYGLGLSIAKKIVEEHNGSIRAVSAVNKGTTFQVVLRKFT